MLPEQTKSAYRPDIDGLRGVAVLLVVLFHAHLAFPGGYVGVDVFFVISGYLITGIIWRELQAGRFSLVNFWERRARRILPALVVMTVFTMALGWLLLLPTDFVGLGRSVAAQTMFGANVYFWKTSGYFAGPSDVQPMLHTWSLAVEEQFYMLTPLLMLGMAAVPRLATRSVMMGVLLAGFVGSLALSVYAVPRYPNGAFYLLPTRAWELLAGALLALMPTWKDGPRGLASLAGLLLVLVPAATYDASTPFPGLAAVPPCLGAALLIASNASSLTPAGRLLAARPLVFVGLISYSLYLWHWPPLALARYWSLAPLTRWETGALATIGGVAAVLSWWFVERPFRDRRICGSRRPMFAFAGGSMACIMLGAVSIVVLDGAPGRMPEALQHELARNDFAAYSEVTIEQVRENRLPRVGASDPGVPSTLLLWGDSHAMAALPAIEQLCKEHGIAATVVTRSSTAPAAGYFNLSMRWGMGRQAEEFTEAVLERIKADGSRDVLLIAYWWAYEHAPPSPGSPDIREALLATVRRLAALGVRPWIMLQVPAHPFDVPKGLARCSIIPGDLSEFCSRPDGWNGIAGQDEAYLDELRAAGARLIDPRPAFLDPQTGYYQVARDGRALYKDMHHLTTFGAQTVLAPALRPIFDGTAQ